MRHIPGEAEGDAPEHLPKIAGQVPGVHGRRRPTAFRQGEGADQQQPFPAMKASTSPGKALNLAQAERWEKVFIYIKGGSGLIRYERSAGPCELKKGWILF
jgi:hypothetical protein